MDNFNFRFEPTADNVFVKFNELFTSIKCDFLAMDLTIHQADEIVNLITKLSKGICETHRLLVDDDKVKSLRKMNLFYHELQPQLNAIANYHKRRKEIHDSPNYVHQQEKAIGFKWKQVVDQSTGSTCRKFEQNTFEYIPLLETIRTELSDPELWKIYQEHNLNKDHVCEDGMYRDVCCGSTQRKNALLQDDPLALQLQLYTDEFDPCDPIKSKSGRHKVCYLNIYIKTKFSKS